MLKLCQERIETQKILKIREIQFKITLKYINIGINKINKMLHSYKNLEKITAQLERRYCQRNKSRNNKMSKIRQNI